MIRDGFIFYRSFYEGIKELPRDIQGEVLTAIMEYGLNGETTENLKPVARAIFTLIKPQIDANNKKFENGKKGGRPPKNETKEKPKNNQTKTTPEPKELKSKDKANEKEKEEKGKIPFDDFWNLYDKKKGDRRACQKKWGSLKNDTQEYILSILPKYVASFSDRQFQPYPQTFLNQERWKNEIEEVKPRQSAQKGKYSNVGW